VGLCTEDNMADRLVRYADLIPCRTAFLDTRTPGSTEKENFTIIGAGVSESADQHVHITERHGFNIGAARQPFGCVNSQHSHDTAEVFIIHSGRWRLTFGPNQEDGSLEIGPGDVASVPIHMFRGFEKIDEGVGFLWTILGEDDPGKVLWAPAVFEAAADHGLRLAKGGRLIDTTAGDYALRDAEVAETPDDEKLRDLRTPALEALQRCVVLAGNGTSGAGAANQAVGVHETSLIAPRQTRDGFGPGPIVGWWPQAFNLRRLTLETGAYIPTHVRHEPEVLMVHEGSVEIRWPDGASMLAAGDTLTLPVGLPRSLRNTSSATADVFVVRGSDDPAPPTFL
jgi:mannose-6-phosphate isomerase-like protein (cupin superfamily)